MKTKIFTLLFAVIAFLFCFLFSSNSFAASVTDPAVLPDWYADVEGKSGAAVVTALHTICNKSYSGIEYGSGKRQENCVWSSFYTTDVYPADSAGKAGKIWDMYSNVVWESRDNQCGASYTNVGDCYNREHSLPKSWFGVGEPIEVGPGTDMHHMYPTDGAVNNQRNNYPFGECTQGTYLEEGSYRGTGKLGRSTLTGYTGTVWEPDDQYKGDFARTYMYMLLKWNAEGVSFRQDKNFGKVTFNDTFDAANNYGLTTYGVTLLMKWHRQDPVSKKEIARNNAVQAIQGNRNPFIDYPILAEYLWGDKKDEVFLLENALGSFEADFIPGESDGERKTPRYQIQWKVEEEVIFSERLKEGSQPTLPTVPECTPSRVFMGWTVSSSIDPNQAPEDLFRDAAPLVTQEVIYYAVFADKDTKKEVITFVPGTDTGTSEVSKSGVTCKLSNTSKADYYQIYKNAKGTFSSTGWNIRKIEFTCTEKGTAKYGPGNVRANVGSYTYEGETGTWTGDANAVELSASEQVRMKSLTVTIGKDEIVYSNYSLVCIPKYKVSFINNGEPYTEIFSYEGTEITNVDDPVLCDPCSFVGWSTHQYSEDNAQSPVIDFEAVIPNEDRTYYAVYVCTTESETPSKTNDYKKINGVDELTNDHYLVVSQNEHYVAMSTTWKNTYYLAPEEVTVKEDIISNPINTIIWQIEVDKAQGVLTFENAQAGYLSLVQSGTYYNIRLGNTQENHQFTYQVENGKWIFSSATFTDRQLEYFRSKDNWTFYTAQDGPVYLFKQQEGNTIVTYVSTYDCGTKPQSIPVTVSTERVEQNRKILRNGQLYILRGDKIYTITGQAVK